MLVVALTLIACASSARPDPAAATAGDDIRAGRAESGYPEVGQLLATDGSRCTATLVAEEWALTASHCVDGHSPDELLIGERARRIASSSKHPSYLADARGSSVRGLDVALVRLADRVTDVRPAALSSVSEVSTRTDLFVRSVGFGLDDEGAVGTKRSALEWITRIDAENVTTRGISGSTDRGDSGGPAYLGTAVVAVTSRGFGASLSARTDAARAWLDATTQGAIRWVPAEVIADPEAPREVCDVAASRLCGRTAEERDAARTSFLASCIEAYATCGQPPAFAVCTADALRCDDVARCSMLPKAACLSAVPPSAWPDAMRANACDEYARAREACDGGRVEAHRADCARRFDACSNALPEAVRCELRERQACAPSQCLERAHCL